MSFAALIIAGCGDQALEKPVDTSSNTSVDAGLDAAPDGSAAPGPATDTESLRPLDTGAHCETPHYCDGNYTGIEWDCQNRFVYGINYAWRHFGSDFGGTDAWETYLPGISGDIEGYKEELAHMKDHGANVVRWWMFPSFHGLAFDFDEAGTPVGIGGTLIEDVEAALAIADELDIYLMLCIFSFDSFKIREGVNLMGPLVRDPVKRDAMMELMIRPMAKAVALSPHAHRLMSWDLINEPEWAVKGAGVGGDEEFTPMDDVDAVTHAEMFTFLEELIVVLREETESLITVGATAYKWVNAWLDLDQDFYQFHMYTWINYSWPYYTPPSRYELDKPVIMGEFYLRNMDPEDPTTANFLDMIRAFYIIGYAGALPWQYVDVIRDDRPILNVDDLTDLKVFADEHPCETQFSGYGAP